MKKKKALLTVTGVIAVYFTLLMLFIRFFKGRKGR